MPAPLIIPGALKLAALTKGLIGTGFGLAAKKSAGLAASSAAKKVAADIAKKKALALIKQKTAESVARPAGQNLLKIVAQRAGYTPTELAINILPDVGMNLLYADQIPGDGIDKALAIGSNIVVGQGVSALGRSAINAGRIGRTAQRTESKIRELMKAGKKVDPRLLDLQDKLGKKQMLPQGIETAGMMLGGLAAYPVGEHMQKAKSFVSGDGYLSPTDKMFINQDEQTKAELLAAYEAGQASGAQGGYIYDPYSGDVPVGGYYGY